MNPDDRRLGMASSISRRDFLNGVAVGTGGLLASSWLAGCGFSKEVQAAAAQDRPGYNPPSLTGLRGSHPGSFELAHDLRDGTFWAQQQPAESTGESYDVVIVGGGISGLAAAYFYRAQAGPSARILILDNHDDFGGHAKRNEFRPGGRLLVLIKPQFEVGRGGVGKGGLVRDEPLRRRVVAERAAELAALGLELVGTVDSAVAGAEGNVEAFALLERGPAA